MNKLFEPICNSKMIREILKSIKDNLFSICIDGCLESQKCHLFSLIKSLLNHQAIFVTYSDSQAKKLYDDIKFFLSKNVYYYPAKDFIYYNATVKSNDIYKQRFLVLNSLMKNENAAIILSIHSLFDRLTEPSYFKDSILKLKQCEIFDIENLSRHLIFLGYEKTQIVEGPGQFSVRGGIFDIHTSNLAIRLEFFDNQIDSIRLFDTITQRSIKSIDCVEITPMRELIFSQKNMNDALKRIKYELQNELNKINNSEQEKSKNLQETFSQIINEFEEQKRFAQIDKYANFFCDKEISLIDYLKKDAIVFIDEPMKTFEIAKKFYNDYKKMAHEKIKSGYMLPGQSKIIFESEKVIEQLKNKSCILIENFHQESDFSIKKSFTFDIKSIDSIKIHSDLFINDLKNQLADEKIIIMLCATEQSIKKNIHYLADKNIAVERLDTQKKIQPKRIYLALGKINCGFEYTNEKFILLCDNFAASQTKRKFKNNRQPIQNFLDLKIGDLIVHEKHGIAIYKGIEKINVDGITKDYLKLEYADGGNLFVHTLQMDLIQKYIGTQKVRLNKLGSSEWHKTKLRVSTQVQKIAADLINLYAKRKNARGFKFSPDNIWQTEFENSFPYEETDDQLAAVKDIKKDMESDIIMDRLICGDVGYGKTEVAVRAAFKAVQDSKQVAYLVPTTILAKQHYNTFLKRLEDFPVNIEMLSRFRSNLQQKKIISEFKSGKIDIVIGTHKLLSDDINFKNLGLIIIDEEQRFGVSHKEKLKRLCENTDVLTLSATPIPRTLNMSLSGIRDISLLTEPPHERQPVQTYVLEYSPDFIKQAIEKELERNGQVYYLYNKVKNIASVAFKIKELVPNATVRYVHGQLSKIEIENIMEAFINKEVDILVCTTIIETGMDIRNVNTIIIEDADNMGLSQLYQLRGRVGRSDKLAYAYLTYRKNKLLNEVAQKRLQTIREFTQFGAGFKIAMKDLEIRGAGNLLGTQQHGNIESIGYDLYCKILNEEIKKLKGEQIPNNFETSIDVNIDAYIPDFYINDEKQKLDIYKKISFVSNKEDYMKMQDELIDRYSDIPECVQNLLDIALIKSLAQKLCITSINQKQNNLIMKLDKDSALSLEKLMELIKINTKIFFTTNPTPRIIYKFDQKINLKSVQKFLFYFLEKN